jgi:hypothetical protein
MHPPCPHMLKLSLLLKEVLRVLCLCCRGVQLTPRHFFLASIVRGVFVFVLAAHVRGTVSRSCGACSRVVLDAPRSLLFSLPHFHCVILGRAPLLLRSPLLMLRSPKQKVDAVFVDEQCGRNLWALAALPASFATTFDCMPLMFRRVCGCYSHMRRRIQLSHII